MLQKWQRRAVLRNYESSSHIEMRLSLKVEAWKEKEKARWWRGTGQKSAHDEDNAIPERGRENANEKEIEGLVIGAPAILMPLQYWYPCIQYWWKIIHY